MNAKEAREQWWREMSRRGDPQYLTDAFKAFESGFAAAQALMDAVEAHRGSAAFEMRIRLREQKQLVLGHTRALKIAEEALENNRCDDLGEIREIVAALVQVRAALACSPNSEIADLLKRTELAEAMSEHYRINLERVQKHLQHVTQT